MLEEDWGDSRQGLTAADILWSHQDQGFDQARARGHEKSVSIST
jgi:hypothetical protein